METAAPLIGGGGGNSLALPGPAAGGIAIVIGTASPATDRTTMGATAKVVANMCAPGAGATPTPMGAAPIDAMYCCSGYPPPTPTPGYAAITFAAMGAC